MGIGDKSDEGEGSLGPRTQSGADTSCEEASSIPTAGMLSAAGQQLVAAETELRLEPEGSYNSVEPEIAEAAERFDTRDAVAADIPAMVAIDIVAFRRVYAGQGKTDEALRHELTAMFEARLRILGGEMMPVVIQCAADGQEEIVGFAHLMRTNKSPADFVSWEDSTANGWLADRHDPDGRYIYVVTLSMSPAVAREDAPSLLVARARAIMVRLGCELIYSESRLPGLRWWVERWCQDAGVLFDDLSNEDRLRLATEYFGLTRTDPATGLTLPRDPMLAFCVQIGNMPQRLVAGAYRDEQSLHFGAVCVMSNPLPVRARTAERIARVSRLFLNASHSLGQANALASGQLPPGYGGE